jgi:pyridinium-3,5-bisthiocarboxylic acid mononucleotide nickel chelatase
MRVCHIDPFSGASGNMLLAALLDAGAARRAVDEAVTALGVGGWALSVEATTRRGLRALHARVDASDDAPARAWRDIRRLLDGADLDEAVRARAAATSTRLAEAEGRVHGVAADDVHFHEVGGLDAIVDVVGVCAAFSDLGVARVTSSPVALGGGQVTSAHGVLPVPAPAVLELLQGAPVHGGDEAHELCTPTGAALLAEWVDAWGAMPPLTVAGSGYGAGTRELTRPNVLRVTVGEAAAHGDPPVEALVLLEATIDDMPGELTPVVLDALRAAGARDAWARQVVMKKGRPGVELVCLAGPDTLPAVRGELFRQSTTLGVRAHPVERWALERATVTVDVAGQPVRIKLGRAGGTVVNAAPEFDDCARAAAATGLPVKQVLDRARAAWLTRQVGS